MRVNKRALFALPVHAVAGPAIFSRMFNHASAYGVEFDIAIATQHVVFFIGETGPEAAFPERAASSIAAIDVLHVALSQALHQITDAIGLLTGEQQVHVIAHQYISVHATTFAASVFLQPFEEESIVVVGEETELPIVASLDEMNRNVRQHDAWTSGHKATH